MNSLPKYENVASSTESNRRDIDVRDFFPRKANSIGVMLLMLVLLFIGSVNAQPRSVRVIISTELGDIEVKLDARRAPATVANFLKYVDAGYYTGGRFHRTVKLTPDNQPNSAVKIEVIQAGPNPEKTKLGFPAIALERTNLSRLKHLNGTISMARSGPDTATSDVFICVGDQPELDFGGKRNPDGQGFAAFGRVVKGLKIVGLIQQSPAEKQSLTPPIVIKSINRIR